MISQTLQPSVARAMPVHVAERGSLVDWGVRAPRYALIVIFLWFGALKFTDYEASGIAPLIMNSPLVMWLHGTFGVAGAAHFLGVYELATGLLIAARRWQPWLGVVGGAMAVLCFLITLSFLFTTPGVVQPGYGVLALSPMPGQFLLKDLVLLGVSFWVMVTALADARMPR